MFYGYVRRARPCISGMWDDTRSGLCRVWGASLCRILRPDFQSLNQDKEEAEKYCDAQYPNTWSQEVLPQSHSPGSQDLQATVD
jgi:hypothetical protein